MYKLYILLAEMATLVAIACIFDHMTAKVMAWTVPFLITGMAVERPYFHIIAVHRNGVEIKPFHYFFCH